MTELVFIIGVFFPDVSDANCSSGDPKVSGFNFDLAESWQCRFGLLFHVRVGVVVVTNRGDGLKVIKSRTMSTKFLQLFSLFSFTVDSQCFIA